MAKRKFDDLTGRVFGKLTAIRFEKRNHEGRPTWLCRCECGNSKVIIGRSLVCGETKSCGCLRRALLGDSRRGKKFGPSFKRRNLLGQTFGRLEVLGLSTPTGSGRIRWECICTCGNTCYPMTGHLISGHTQSCGCINDEGIRRKGRMTDKQREAIRDYHTNKEYAPLKEKSPEKIVWECMKNRCYNPKDTGYVYYGGRGTSVCDRWLNSFENFLADVGTRPGPEYSIDRFPNNAGNYEPGNVRWATRIEQNNNRRPQRKTGTINLTYKGKTQSASAWSREIGISDTLIKHRFRQGLPMEKVLAPRKIRRLRMPKGYRYLQ